MVNNNPKTQQATSNASNKHEHDRTLGTEELPATDLNLTSETNTCLDIAAQTTAQMIASEQETSPCDVAKKNTQLETNACSMRKTTTSQLLIDNL